MNGSPRKIYTSQGSIFKNFTKDILPNFYLGICIVKSNIEEQKNIEPFYDKTKLEVLKFS